MLQLSKNQAVNTFAIYPNILPVSGSQLYIEYTQSYNQNSGSLISTIISNPQNTPWVISTLSGSTLPSASGQYLFNIYEYEQIFAVWNTDTDIWNLADTIWDNGGTFGIADLISVDRAFISGSDVEPITQYLSPDEDGYYITYLG